MDTYVDGFVLPIAKDAIESYKALAGKAAAVWMRHGALDYREAVLDDPDCKDMVSFPTLAGAKEGETVVFAWVTYKSREDRDAVNAKVMSDPELTCDTGDGCPFDYKRMAYGGFNIIVSAGKS